MKKQLWAHLALLLVALIYGGNYVIAKVVMGGGYLRPLPFILVRAVTATLLFWLLYRLFQYQPVERKDLLRLAGCGLFGIAINQMFFFTGLDLTSPVNASLIMTTTPILVLVASFFMLGERITLSRTLGIGLGAAGAILLITAGREVQFGADGLLGDLLVLVNSSSYGFYLVLVKPLMKKYSPLTVITWVFTFGALMVVPFGLPGLLRTDWASFTPTVWWAVAYVVLLVTFLVYLLNAVALKQVSPSVVSIYIYLQPLVAGLLSVWLGMESMNGLKLLAGALIFAGVFLASGKPGAGVLWGREKNTRLYRSRE